MKITLVIRSESNQVNTLSVNTLCVKYELQKEKYPLNGSCEIQKEAVVSC